MQNPPTHQNYSTPRRIKPSPQSLIPSPLYKKIWSFGFAHKDLSIKLITHLNLQGELTSEF